MSLPPPTDVDADARQGEGDEPPRTDRKKQKRVVLVFPGANAITRGLSFARAGAKKRIDAILRATLRAGDDEDISSMSSARAMRAMVHRGNRIGNRDGDAATNHLGLCLQVGFALASEGVRRAVEFTETRERGEVRRVKCDVAPCALSEGERTPGFEFVADAPAAFAAVRRAWGMDEDAYRKSLALDGFERKCEGWDYTSRGCLKGRMEKSEEALATSRTTLRVISQSLASGKSSSWFFCSEDGTLLVKTCDASERKVLLGMLPRYTEYAKENSATSILPQFYGLYTVKFGKSAELSFVVMNYWFASTKHIRKRYDLKGSTMGRFASEREKKKGDATIWKDNDFDEVDAARTRHATEICNVLKKDAEFLASCNLIDYSLVYGHYIAETEYELLEAAAAFADQEAEDWQAECDAAEPSTVEVDDDVHFTPRAGGARGDDDGFSPDEDFGSCAGPTSAVGNGDSPMFDLGSEEGKERQLVLLSHRKNPFSAFFGDVTRVNQLRVINMEKGAAFVGVIDVLTPYGWKKRFENFFTGKLMCCRDVSCQPPKRYAERFHTFMEERVFLPA